MASIVGTLLIFVIALIISTLIIYVIVKFFGESEGITTALLAALVGTVIYTVLYALLGQGLLAAFIAGIAWLLALQMLVLNRLDQIPAHCCYHLGSDLHCRMVPANAHRSLVITGARNDDSIETFIK